MQKDNTQVEINNISDVFTKKLYGTAEFPQPFIAGYGYVTSAGAIGQFFFSSLWTVAKTATGVYEITHPIGDTTYMVSPTAIEDPARIIQVGAINAKTFTVKTYDAAGVAQDTAFSFVVYKVLL